VKILSIPLREETDVLACSQPYLSSGESGGARRVIRIEQARWFELDGFMTLAVRRLRFWRLRKQTGWLHCNRESYLRLETYTIFDYGSAI